MDIFTIGHSTHDQQKFVAMLKSFDIQVLVDVRSFPGSRHMPHFNRENMQEWLPKEDIKYIHIPRLGGRRRELPGVDNALIEGWTHIAFRNYSAYTLTPDFEQALAELADIATHTKTCIMCAESVPWRCHRLLISNCLSFKGFSVHHIMDQDKTLPHVINKYGAQLEFDGKRVIYPKQP